MLREKHSPVDKPIHYHFAFTFSLSFPFDFLPFLLQRLQIPKSRAHHSSLHKASSKQLHSLLVHHVTATTKTQERNTSSISHKRIKKVPACKKSAKPLQAELKGSIKPLGFLSMTQTCKYAQPSTGEDFFEGNNRRLSTLLLKAYGVTLAEYPLHILHLTMSNSGFFAHRSKSPKVCQNYGTESP